MRLNSIPPLSVVQNPSVDAESRLQGTLPPSTGMDSEERHSGFKPGPFIEHSWTLERNKIPAIDYEHSRFNRTKGHDFKYVLLSFLAHLSTTCSRGAFRVVMCPSCVVNNFFKHLLLPNRWANLDQTWQECSLGGPLQKLFTEFDSIKNSGCHGNEIEFFKQFFKNLLL